MKITPLHSGFELQELITLQNIDPVRSQDMVCGATPFQLGKAMHV
jgi:hypothetical protein